MTQTAQIEKPWMRFYNQAMAFAQRVTDSVDVDLELMRRPPDPILQVQAPAPEPDPAAKRRRNRLLLHAFGTTWNAHNQQHDAQGGTLNKMLLRVWRESAAKDRNIDEVASSTRHCPVSPLQPSIN